MSDKINEDNCVLTSRDMLLLDEALSIMGRKEINEMSFQPWCQEIHLKITKLNDMAKQAKEKSK